MLDLDKLRAFAQSGLAAYLDALVQGRDELEKSGINTPLRLCHFLAQTAHETGGYTILRENTNWTAEQMCALWPKHFKKGDKRVAKCCAIPGPEGARARANLAYSARADIGNLGGDDGWAYRGGGFLQDTGRARYHEVGNAIGVDLEGSPELIEDPRVSLQTALWTWDRYGLNFYADRNYGRAIGNAINRGTPYAKDPPIGAQQRDAWFKRAWAIFGDGELPDTDTLYMGAYGAKVERVQKRLLELGYGAGSCDKVFGPAMARAVAAFKVDHSRSYGVELDPPDVVGPMTLAALDAAEPIRVSPERESATPAQLAAAGSREVAAGMESQLAGKSVVGLGLFEGARQTGLLEGITQNASSISAAKYALVPAIEAVSWASQNIGFVLLIIVGIWIWRGGHRTVMARLEAHVKGWNLFR